MSLYEGQLRFTLKLFNAINRAKAEDNIFFSPYSVYHTLLLAYFSSANKTEESLKHALEINDNSTKLDVVSAYKFDKFQRELTEKSVSYEFRSANKLFAALQLEVRDCMLKLFKEELETLNFQKDPKAARVAINQWIANQTKNQIKDLIPEDAITANTKLVLANAAYFKGLWSSQFQPERTKKEVFYVSPDRQTFVPMMKQKGTFSFSVNEDLGAHILELPYKGGNVSMYIFLPPFSNPEGVSNIIKNLTPDKLQMVVEEGALMAREVIVEIPKFSMEKEIDLKSVLEDMGVGDLFQDSSDFSSFTGAKNVHFDDAIHKAKIEIDEQGTVAAAATVVFGFRSSRPVEPAKFIANFPFVYVIYDRPTNSVLFMGVYRDPKKN